MTVAVDQSNTETIAKRFEVFHRENPEVYTELVKLAREMKGRGYDKFGIATIYEVLRWRKMLGTNNRATAVEFAWAAGLFEGEGSFFCRTEPGHNAKRMTFSMTDEDVVRKFHRIVGVGKVYGPRWQQRNGERIPNRKPYWCWTLDRWEDLWPLVEEMLPYLGKRQRDRAFKILDTPPGIPGRRRKDGALPNRRPNTIRRNKPPDEFKLNANFRAYYARMIMDREEDLKGCFDVRRIGSETHVAP